jgi:RNA polymerase sigma-70 factor (ECF subfamily)
MQPTISGREPADAEQPPDAELVARTRAGDAAALELLVRRHYGAAYAVALAILGIRADAEDACHDAFVRAAERLAECRHPDRFGAWLRTIVRNHARNEAARRAVRRALPLETVTAAQEAASPRDLERAELARRLEAALAGLSPAQREVVLLHDLEGWTHEAIATSLGTSVVMSRQHLFQARRRLRSALGPTLLQEYQDG